MYRRPTSLEYENKPFKPPVARAEVNTITSHVSSQDGGRPVKTPTTLDAPKRRLISEGVAEKKPKTLASELGPEKANEESLHVVLFRKKTTKKHKTWDGEGLLIVKADGTAIFKCDTAGGDNYREEGRKLTKVNLDGVISIGGFEVEVDHRVSDPVEFATFAKFCQQYSVSLEDKESRLAGSATISSSPIPVESPKGSVAIPVQKFKSLVPLNNRKPACKSKRMPLYDPEAPDAFVLPRPTGSTDAVDVVVDPTLSAHLREHQKEGVAFLYECVMGFRDFGGNGALLADEMGLGKTLTSITLMWTLLKQSPYSSEQSVARKILIACPVTLIGNWKKEIKKWLGIHKASVLTINGTTTVKADKLSIINFGKTRVYQLLIMGYEKIVSMSDELDSVNFDLLICDEGHRLKSGQGKTLKVLNGLNIDRRVLLTGTPIQNDLSEFYNIINFINPGVLGSFSKFQRDFMKPILRAREINCKNPDVIAMGDKKSSELINVVKEFTLRRTNDILTDHLPPKTDIILFVRPTKLQLSLFDFLMSSKQYVSTVNKNNYNDSLSLIMLFRKICNSPSLVIEDKMFQEINSNCSQPVGLDFSQKIVSGKIKALIQLLNYIRNLDEKVVLISNFTQTLDVLEKIIEKLGYSFTRLDGSTPNKLRDRIVTNFNNSSSDGSFIFLLSAKSGGVGLNLIGASRLILFDNDWNPAIDLQAMARVHRDGQKKPVFIYRLFTTGSIDEKIFQRQLMKSNLSDKFLDEKTESKDDLFDYSDLKDLFSLDRESLSNTHSLLECDCGGTGEELVNEVEDEESSHEQETGETSESGVEQNNNESSWMSALDYKQISQDPAKKKIVIKNCLVGYKHIDPAKCDEHEDEVLSKMMMNAEIRSCISYIFTKRNKSLI